MARGLEIRSPFLHHRPVEPIGSLPADQSMHRLCSKPLMRDGLGTPTPAAGSAWRKHGFIVPIARWIDNDLRACFDEIINERLAADLIDVKKARVLLDSHRSGCMNRRKPLWNLAAPTLWHEGARDCL